MTKPKGKERKDFTLEHKKVLEVLIAEFGDIDDALASYGFLLLVKELGFDKAVKKISEINQ